MIKQYLLFLNQLKDNNNREWFLAHKKEYEALNVQYMEWVDMILARMVVVDDALAFLSVKDCVFRINRDVRFTNDKSPYKTRLSGIFSNSGKSGHNCGYYFEISIDGQLMVGGGQYYLFPKDLLRVRQYLVKDASKLRAVLRGKEFLQTFGGLAGEVLKTYPKGFNATTPNIDLLKYKNYIATVDIDINQYTDEQIADIIVDKFQVTKPLVGLLRSW
jgi:uncharacterized protein (TIGR02453 family)